MKTARELRELMPQFNMETHLKATIDQLELAAAVGRNKFSYVEKFELKEAVVDYFRAHGYSCHWTDNGRETGVIIHIDWSE